MVTQVMAFVFTWHRTKIALADMQEPPGGGSERELEALLEKSQGEAGIVASVWEKNTQMIAMPVFFGIWNSLQSPFNLRVGRSKP